MAVVRASGTLSRVALLPLRTPALAGARFLSAKPVRLSKEEIANQTPEGWTMVSVAGWHDPLLCGV